jgi:hypothetical protein
MMQKATLLSHSRNGIGAQQAGPPLTIERLYAGKAKGNQGVTSIPQNRCGAAFSEISKPIT